MIAITYLLKRSWFLSSSSVIWKCCSSEISASSALIRLSLSNAIGLAFEVVEATINRKKTERRNYYFVIYDLGWKCIDDMKAKSISLQFVR